MKTPTLNEEQILTIVDRHGHIGRHNYKWSNANINKKLRKMCKDKKLVRLKDSTKEYTYYGRPIETQQQGEK